MNKTPSILVDTGFEVDANGVLTELVIPNVVTTLNTPAKIVFNGTTLNYVPSTPAALEEFYAPNITAITNTVDYGGFGRYTALHTISFPKLLDYTDSGGHGFFWGCDGLVEVTFEKLRSSSVSSAVGYGCLLGGCNGLRVANFPQIQTVTSGSTTAGIFINCPALNRVTFGSEGHPVVSLSAYTFRNMTQAIDITVYTSDGNALANSPFGATNATIVYEEA